MPIFNEIVTILLIIGGFIILGVSPVIMQVRSKNKPQRWGYKYSNVGGQSSSASISLDNMTVATPAVTPVNEPVAFGDVEMTDYTEIVKSVKQLQNQLEPQTEVTLTTSTLEENSLSRIFELCSNEEEIQSAEMEDNDAILDRLFGEISNACGGINTASLVTTSISRAEVDKMHVIFGVYDEKTSSLIWNDEKIELSSSERIFQSHNELLLVKGMLLMNGQFRVLSYDAPENIEAGYNVDSFLIDEDEEYVS